MSNKLKIVLPKGRIYENISRLFEDVELKIIANGRAYFPMISDPEIEVKIMKPQNIARLVELGSHDAGFTGLDWIVESEAAVTEVLDLNLDPVRIVAAVPEHMDEKSLRSRKITVASEYSKITGQFLTRRYPDYLFIRSYGATEAFPPADADMIIDNTSSGKTLRDNNLKIISEIMTSSTRFIANNRSMNDPWKREKIEKLKTLFEGVLNARQRLMLEMNVPAETIDAVVGILPCMRAPTISSLYNDAGYSVKAAVKRSETARLIPQLKKLKVSDILVYEMRKVIV